MWIEFRFVNTDLLLGFVVSVFFVVRLLCEPGVRYFYCFYPVSPQEPKAKLTWSDQNANKRIRTTTNCINNALYCSSRKSFVRNSVTIFELFLSMRMETVNYIVVIKTNIYFSMSAKRIVTRNVCMLPLPVREDSVRSATTFMSKKISMLRYNQFRTRNNKGFCKYIEELNEFSTFRTEADAAFFALFLVRSTTIFVLCRIS